jgi:hypothetical protein
VRPAPQDADVLAELLEHRRVAALKALTGGREHDHRHDTPEDAEHRQEAAQLVGAQILEDLDEDFTHDGG